MRDRLRVLHLPTNISSQISVTVRALRDIGIDARGIVTNSHWIQDHRDIEIFEIASRRKQPILGLKQTYSWWKEVLKSIRWADVVHWHFRMPALPIDLDLKYIAILNKARVVEFWGDDIRIPEIAVVDNPYRARNYEEYPMLANGARERSFKTQRRFAQYGFECLVPARELDAYIQKDLFPSPYKTRARLIMSDFDPVYPSPDKKRPLLIHTPSRKEQKGTKSVLTAIEKLKCRYDFDFKLVNDVEHAKALEIIKSCDIMIDQFTIGDHGLATLEAMAFGKPTVCYIKPSIIPKFPADLPIINAHMDNLAEVLGSLLENGLWRNQIGRKSRRYVEKYHDAHQIAKNLVTIYQESIEKRQRARRGNP